MKVVIAAGGTGGHFFPALEVAESLRSANHDCFFIGSFKIGAEQLVQRNFAYQMLKVKGFVGGNVLSKIEAIWLMSMAIIKSIRILKKEQVDAVLGFGGYSSFAVVKAAQILKIPTMIHEQNVVPGKANEWSSKKADRIAVSFQKTKEFFPKQKTILTGYPLKIKTGLFEKKDILQKLGLENEKFTVLILGGSQGSQRINELSFAALKSLNNKEDYQVVHISGAEKEGRLIEAYEEAGIKAQIYSFYEAMDELYTVADCVISRAGAGTVMEIALFGLPAILIPYPLAGGHQKENASVFKNQPEVSIIEECNLTSESIAGILKERQNSRESNTESMQRKQSIVIEDAAERIVQAAEEICQSTKN